VSDNALKRDPFGPATRTTSYVPRPATEEALARLERAVVKEGRVGLLYGPAGLGKTLLLRRLAEGAQRTLKPVHLPYAAMTPDEVCSWTLEALGASAVDDPPTVFRAWLEHLRRERTLLLLVVDDATALPAETAGWLGQLAKDGALRLVLAGLSDAGAPPLRDELPEDAELVHLAEAMSEEETRAYIEARLALAEVPAEQRARFDLKAIRKIHAIAQGNPRRLHHAAGAVLRGADPDTIVAFLDGLDPAETAAAPDAPRVTLGAALLAERRAEEARRPPPRRIKPMHPIEPCDLETLAQGGRGLPVEPRPPIELPAAEPEGEAGGPAAGSEVAPASAEVAPAAASRPIPDTSEVVADALAGDGDFLEELGFGEAEGEPPAPLPISRAAQRPAPAAPVASEDGEVVLRKAGRALVDATGLLREATLSLGEPGTPRGQVRAALRDAVDALSEAIVAVHAAERRAGGASPRRTLQPQRRLGGALVRVGAVVGGSALIGAAAVFLFSGSEEPVRELDPTPPVLSQALPEPAPVAQSESTPPLEEVAPPPAVFEIGINARPWAKVEVDGADVGMTPIAGLALTEGLHIFRAQMPDGRIVVERVEIGPETRSLVFR
jgi:type II secretory pathway predicted ATPase ExeA